jgi:coproporphyrinogen III oxidase
MKTLVHRTQEEICSALERLNDRSFRQDIWTRPEGGGGKTRIVEGSALLDRGGVNVSEVHGTLSKSAIQAMAERIGRDVASWPSNRFYATGVSLVLHPRNPFAPTVHANYRYFEIEASSSEAGVWWFGGGADLTPNYLFEEDASHFHRALKAVCDNHDPQYYATFKDWCDRYFLVQHRQETRGVGGIFFDDLNDRDPEQIFAFVRDCAEGLLPAYLPILERRMDHPFSEEHEHWKQLRRGRYVEFNLVYDRGTKFGLHTGGRVESILMSLPDIARWNYDMKLEPGSPEDRLLAVLRSPRAWI